MVGETETTSTLSVSKIVYVTEGIDGAELLEVCGVSCRLVSSLRSYMTK